MEPREPIFPHYYLPPVSYFAVLTCFVSVRVEGGDSFQKSTLRNRCYILGPNGKLRLTIPIQGGKSQHKTYRVMLPQAGAYWQRQHWQSLCTCYRSSPYFEFYEDEFAGFFLEPPPALYEFNKRLLVLLLQLLGIDTKLSFSDIYEKDYPGVDLRHRWDGRGICPWQPPIYRQVFTEPSGFVPDLSILDLLFNHGPEAGNWLKEAGRNFVFN